jgi:hypothetical protein
MMWIYFRFKMDEDVEYFKFKNLKKKNWTISQNKKRITFHNLAMKPCIETTSSEGLDDVSNVVIQND